MYELVGYIRRTGEYQGRPFDNYNLHCKVMDPPEGMEGEAVEVLKVKTAVVDAFTAAHGPLSIGDVIDVYYDRFGRITSIMVR